MTRSRQTPALALRILITIALFFAVGPAATRDAAAQATSSAFRTVTGRVVRPTMSSVVSVSNSWVVLHRVAPDTSRPIDSVRTNANGAFRIRFRPVGNMGAIYFLATRWQGIAYFSPPLRTTGVAESAVLTVFDTTSSGLALRERGRHVIVFAPRGDGSREVVEVFELANEGARTRVPAGAGRASWSAALPKAALDFRAGQSDISAESIVGSAGKVEVFAPFAPGVKQVSFTYRLPKGSFPLALPPASDTLVLEVLLEEPGATAKGAGLRAMESVTVDGRRLQRWLSPNAPALAPVRIAARGASGRRVPLAVGGLMIALTVTILIALVVGLRRR